MDPNDREDIVGLLKYFGTLVVLVGVVILILIFLGKVSP